MDYDEELDVTGLICPKPAFKSKKKLMSMEPNQVLRVMTDYNPAREAIPRDLNNTKNEFLGEEEDEEGDLWYLYFKCQK